MTTFSKSLLILKTPTSAAIHHRNRLFLAKTLSSLIPRTSQHEFRPVYRVYFEPHVPNISFYAHYYSDLLTIFSQEKIYDPNILLLLCEKGTYNNVCKVDEFQHEEQDDKVFTLENSHNQWKEASSAGSVENDLHERLASGGTFDHMHMGHFLLLTYQAMIYKHNEKNSRFVVGISGDALLKNKRHAHLLEDFTTRQTKVRAILDELRPNMKLDLVELADPYGPTIMDPKITAIVVSEETEPGAVKINEIRQENGMNPLETFVVPCIQAKGESSKMSSSFLREILSAKQ